MSKWICTLVPRPNEPPPRSWPTEAATWFEARSRAAQKWGTTIDRVIAIREPQP